MRYLHFFVFLIGPHSYMIDIFFSSSNLQDLSKGIKMIAGLLDDGDDGKNLLDATRGLAGAFSNLLRAAQEGGGADSEVRTYTIHWLRGRQQILHFPLNIHWTFVGVGVG